MKSQRLKQNKPHEVRMCTLMSFPAGGRYYILASSKQMWMFGLVCTVVGRINEVNQRRARLVLGWVTVSGG